MKKSTQKVLQLKGDDKFNIEIGRGKLNNEKGQEIFPDYHASEWILQLMD